MRTLQLNVGRRCNLACHHCHVEAGPTRREALSRRTTERVLELIDASSRVECLDLTGGAPELWPHFRWLVREARARGLRVIDRCNLTVLFEAGQESTAEFLAEHGVEIVASLPCYTPETVDGQRGKDVFSRSIAALKLLNGLGYARPRSGLRLDLVYNPDGPFLPPDQAELEARYRSELREQFGIEFDRLLVLANLPVGRFARDLERKGELDAYQELLESRFNSDTVPELMCRHSLSIAHDGRIYDCDFDQMLELAPRSGARTVWDLKQLDDLTGRPIATGPHCFGCTAGAGSSCGGALT